MKRILVLALLLGGIVHLQAQTPENRLWSEGPLQWKDFTGFPPADGTALHSTITWRETTKTIKVGYIKYSYTDVHAVFHPKYSFVKPEAATDAGLAEEQRRFNLEELFARRWRDSLLLGVSDVKAARERIKKEAKAAIETDGADTLLAAHPLKEDSFDPVAVRWKEKGGLDAKLGLSNHYLPDTPSGYSAFTNTLFFSVGWRNRMSSVNFEVDLVNLNEIALPRSYPFTRYLSQHLDFGYTIYHTERFYLIAQFGGGIGKYEYSSSDSNVFAELFMARGLVMAEYTPISYMMLKNARRERTDLRLFARIGLEHRFYKEMLAPIILLDFGVAIPTFGLTKL